MILPSHNGDGSRNRHVCDPEVCGITWDDNCPVWQSHVTSRTDEDATQDKRARIALETLRRRPLWWLCTAALLVIERLTDPVWLALAKKLRPFLLRLHEESKRGGPGRAK